MRRFPKLTTVIKIQHVKITITINSSRTMVITLLLSFEQMSSTESSKLTTRSNEVGAGYGVA